MLFLVFLILTSYINGYCPTALFLLDNRLEVYLWQRGEAESSTPAWHEERRCAMQTALQYCTGKSMLTHRRKRSGLSCLMYCNDFCVFQR